MTKPKETLYDSFVTAEISMEHIKVLDDFNDIFLNNRLFLSHYIFEQEYAQMHNEENNFWLDISNDVKEQGSFDPFNNGKISSNRAYFSQSHEAALEENLKFLGYTYWEGIGININETDLDKYIHFVDNNNRYQGTYILKRRLSERDKDNFPFYSFAVEKYQGQNTWPLQTVIDKTDAKNKP